MLKICTKFERDWSIRFQEIMGTNDENAVLKKTRNWFFFNLHQKVPLKFTGAWVQGGAFTFNALYLLS